LVQANGEVIGEMEGTFSKPMQVGNGKTVPPTGKKFKLTMCTVGHWKDGKMMRISFWDNSHSKTNRLSSITMHVEGSRQQKYYAIVGVIEKEFHS